jgi:hypothetical protein
MWSETRTWGQVLLNTAIDPRTEVKLHMKPVAQSGIHEPNMQMTPLYYKAGKNLYLHEPVS